MKAIFPDLENNKIQVLDQRFYKSATIEDKHYPGATTILEDYPKRGLLDWFMKVGLNAKEISRRAMERGSRVHGAIESFCKGESVSCMGEDGNLKSFQGFDEWELVLKFYEWYERYKPEILATELVLVSDELEFGGTLDLLCKLRNEDKEIPYYDGIQTKAQLVYETWLIDYKTGGEYKEHKLQLAAYYKLAESLGIKIDRVGIFYLEAQTRTDKWMQGKGWRVLEITDEMEDRWKMFNHVHEIWKDNNPNYKPKNLIYPIELNINNNERENNNIQEQTETERESS